MSATVVNHVVEGPGDAPAVVLINSLGADLSMWDPQANALRSAFRVVRFDARGHGASPVPPPPYAVADLGEDVLVLLDRLEIERAAMCGVSLGGATAIWLALNAPDRVSRLAVCFSAAYFGAPEGWLQRAATVRARGMTAVVDSVLERWFTPAFAGREPQVVERARTMLAATPAEGYAAGCEAVAGIDLRAELPRIEAPTLVLSGDQDPATPPARGRQIAARVPGAAFAEIPAAHLGNLEQAELVNSLLFAHCRGLQGEGN